MLLDRNDGVKTKILNAILEDPEIVLLLKEKYVDDEIWRFCIEREPRLFKKMRHPSEELCLFACEVDGENLKYIKNKFRYVPITSLMCFTAVKSNPKAILHVPRNLLNDELMEMAFDQNPELMLKFHDIRREYIEKLLTEKPYAIQYVRNIDEDLICDQIRKSPSICPYINHLTLRMVRTLQECHPEYYELYKNNIQLKI